MPRSRTHTYWSRRNSRSRRRDAGGVGAKMCDPGRHVRQWQQCQAVQHPDDVFGDVVRVIQGGQSEVLHTSPRTLAQVKKTPLYVDLLAKHGLALARQQGVDERDAPRAEQSTNDLELDKHRWRQRKVTVHEPRVRATQHAQTFNRHEHDDANVLPAVVPEKRLRVVATSRRPRADEDEVTARRWLRWYYPLLIASDAAPRRLHLHAVLCCVGRVQ